MTKKIKYNILIVCEGENTEPSYFRSIKEIVQHDKGIWPEGVSIIISPIPKIEQELENEENPHKTNRKKRTLNPAKTPIRGEIEEQYRAEPVRFVREAQLGLEDGTFQEVWAVFDDDNRTHKKEAFDLAQQQNNEVNIAYSSISFEHWVLLHFEKCSKPFQQSECREGTIILNCNSGIHTHDCFGDRCIGGYLRNKNYFNASTKEAESIYPYLEHKLETAFINASWLRSKMNLNNQGVPLYDLNPYTDVDCLVKRLFRNEEQVKWILLNNNVETESYKINISRVENNVIFTITNIGDITIILHQDSCFLEDELHNKKEVGQRMLITPTEEKEIRVTINKTNEFNPKYASFSNGLTKVITEIENY